MHRASWHQYPHDAPFRVRNSARRVELSVRKLLVWGISVARPYVLVSEVAREHLSHSTLRDGLATKQFNLGGVRGRQYPLDAPFWVVKDARRVELSVCKLQLNRLTTAFFYADVLCVFVLAVLSCAAHSRLRVGFALRPLTQTISKFAPGPPQYPSVSPSALCFVLGKYIHECAKLLLVGINPTQRFFFFFKAILLYR